MPANPAAQILELPAWDLTARQLCDLELLMNGAFAPLAGFMAKADYEAVLARMRLADGTFWPMPITLDVTREFAAKLKPGDRLALRDAEGFPLARMQLREAWEPDLPAEAQALYGTRDRGDADARALLEHTHPVYLAGDIEALAAPVHYDFAHLRLSPSQTRAAFAGKGAVLAAALEGLPLLADVEAMLDAAQEARAQLFMHPIVGQSALRYLAPGDIDHYARLRCYEHVQKRCAGSTLGLLPLSTRDSASTRELLWRALVHKNYGCTHVLLPLDARVDRAALAAHEQDTGVHFVRAQAAAQRLSQAQLHEYLARGVPLPASAVFPEVAQELRRRYRPRSRRGLTLFFTGLSGSGKSTIARALLARLMEIGTHSITLLDGDLVRKHLSSELGFSREHRNINIARIGYVASEITKHGGIAVCAPIAPYAQTRRSVREMIAQYGGFYEIYVSTPLAVCEARDRKGLYAKARAGIIKEFTGVSDAYEAPENPELAINTDQIPPAAAVNLILERLRADGYLVEWDSAPDYSI
jgi:sulfate adenylyltransferase